MEGRSLKIFWGTHDGWLTRCANYYELWLQDLENAGVYIHRASIGKRIVSWYRKGVWEGAIKPKPLLKNLKINSYDIAVFEDLMPYWKESWKDIKIPKALFVEDLYAFGHRQIKKALEWKFDIIFYRYEDPFFNKVKSEVEGKVKLIWVPHAVNTDFFKPKKGKRSGVTLLGQVTSIYPTRQKVLKELNGESFFTRIKRPEETIVKKKKWPIGKDYAEVLRSSLICPTGGSKHHYAVSKFFEIPASGVLLASDWFSELGRLGFKNNENMIVLKSGEIKKQMKWWLDHPKDRSKIEKAGRKLMKTRHTGKIRAQQFIQRIKDFLKR